jgi:hypothetical protein
VQIPLHQHTLWIFDLQIVMDKPPGCRAAAMADIILTTSRTGATTHIAIEGKERRVTPNVFEAVFVQIAASNSVVWK